MIKRSFEQAFNAVFHDQCAFHEFCHLDLKEEVTEFTIGDRTIFRTSDKLKKYLRFIDKVIFRSLSKDDEVVHSFIKGKSSLTAVKAHVTNKYFFLTDVHDFYSNITSDDVRRILERDSRQVPIDDFDSYIDLVVGLTTYRGSIPVGFSTSPQLSNAFLFEFDRAFNDFCARESLIYTRYADDIIVSGSAFNELSELSSKVQNFLKEYASPGMLINSEKTHITQIGNKVKILGLVVTPGGRITIDSKYKNNIESLVYFYINDKERYADFLYRKFKGDERSVFGLLHYAKSVDEKYIEKLQRKYGVYALRSLMEERPSDKR